MDTQNDFRSHSRISTRIWPRICPLTPLLWMLLALLLPGCGGSGGSSEDFPERLRIVNTSVRESIVHVALGEDLNILADIEYGSATSYLNVDEGKVPIRIRLEDDVLPTIDTSLTIAKGTDNTYLLVKEEGTDGESTTTGTLLTDDNDPDVPEGLFRIRFINAAISSEGIDVYLTRPESSLGDSTPVATNVAYKAASAYLSVDAGTYRIRITRNNGEKAFFDSGAITFESGGVRTVIVFEDEDGGSPYRGALLRDKD